MPAIFSEPGTSCGGCGHAAGLHSNEACEAIRCACRLTRKMLAQAVLAAVAPSAPPIVVAVVTVPVVPVVPAASAAAAASPEPDQRAVRKRGRSRSRRRRSGGPQAA
jgi:hypothetical protein